MKHYLIAVTRLHDRAWVGDYLTHVTRLIHRHGGEVLTRSPSVVHLEGEAGTPDVVSIIAFPSQEAAVAFYESPEYAPYREARQAGSRGDLLLVTGEDVAQRGAE